MAGVAGIAALVRELCGMAAWPGAQPADGNLEMIEHESDDLPAAGACPAISSWRSARAGLGPLPAVSAIAAGPGTVASAPAEKVPLDDTLRL